MKEEIIAVIPARGGSKSIPNKNMVKLGGKPLVMWPIETALSVRRISRVVVSTDDGQVEKIASQLGAEVIHRPTKLSGDEVHTLPVLQHTIRELEQGKMKVGVVILLYPTSPFLRRDRILEALELFSRTKCNSVLGVRTHWKTLWKRSDEGLKRFYPKRRMNRQQIEPLWGEAGEIFFSRRKVIMEMDKIIDPKSVGLIEVEGEEELIEIDEKQDLLKARKWLKLARERGYGR